MTHEHNQTEVNGRALVLSGGGADGAYSVGVLKALMQGDSPATGQQPLRPGIFTGTSIGSFNAAFLVSRWDESGAASVADLEKIWLEQLAGKRNNKAYRIRLNPLDILDPRSYFPNPLRQLRNTAKDSAELSLEYLQRFLHAATHTDEALSRRIVETIDFSTFVSADPWYKLLRQEIDYPAIGRSSRRLRIAAVNWKTGALRIFENQEMDDVLGPEAVAASSALPGFYPPAKVDKTPYIDGGVLLNTPLRPAIDAGATEIHVIYLDPPIDRIALSEPSNTLETLYRMQQISWAATIRNDISAARRMNWIIEALEASGAYEKLPGVIEEFRKRHGRRRKLVIHNHFPKQDFGGALGLLNLERARLERLIQQGFDDATAHDCEDNGCVIPGAVPG